jgi:16S rRNA processing protein RimM
VAARDRHEDRRVDRRAELDAAAPAGRIRIGVVSGVHGLRGALRFKPDNPDSESLNHGTELWFERDGVAVSHRLLEVGQGGRGALRMIVEGVGTIEAAEALKGAVVSIDESDLPPLEPGEFYYFRMIGCEVRTIDGELLGRVEEVFGNGAHDVLVVRDGDAERMLPVIDSVVLTIDLDERKIVVDPIPGLLD